MRQHLSYMVRMRADLGQARGPMQSIALTKDGPFLKDAWVNPRIKFGDAHDGWTLEHVPQNWEPVLRKDMLKQRDRAG